MASENTTPAEITMDFKEFSIARLEEEATNSFEEMRKYDDFLEDGTGNADLDSQYQKEQTKHRMMLERIEAELTRRYSKVREVVENENFLSMSARGLRVHLDIAYKKLNDLSAVFPHPENYYEDYNALDCRITGLTMLLTHYQINSV